MGGMAADSEFANGVYPRRLFIFFENPKHRLRLKRKGMARLRLEITVPSIGPIGRWVAPQHVFSLQV